MNITLAGSHSRDWVHIRIGFKWSWQWFMCWTPPMKDWAWIKNPCHYLCHSYNACCLLHYIYRVDVSADVGKRLLLQDLNINNLCHRFSPGLEEVAGQRYCHREWEARSAHSRLVRVLWWSRLGMPGEHSRSSCLKQSSEKMMKIFLKPIIWLRLWC